MQQTAIDGITPLLARPVELALNWIGQDELLRQLLADWITQRSGM